MSVKYVELVVEGPFHLIKGFVYGVMYGKEIRSRVIISSENGVMRTSFGDIIREWFLHHSDMTHFIVEEAAADAIAIAVSAHKEKLGIVLKSRKEIKAASFRFKYIAYAKYYGDRLNAMFTDLPAGLTVSDDFKPDVRVVPDAAGVEGYAPEHEYEVEAHGTVTGPIKEVLQLHKRAVDEPLVEVEDIELIFS